MALSVTPDGRPILLPDSLDGMFGGPQPLMAGTTLGPRGDGVPSFPTPMPPPQAPPPPPPPLPNHTILPGELAKTAMPEGRKGGEPVGPGHQSLAQSAALPDEVAQPITQPPITPVLGPTGEAPAPGTPPAPAPSEALPPTTLDQGKADEQKRQAIQSEADAEKQKSIALTEAQTQAQEREAQIAKEQQTFQAEAQKTRAQKQAFADQALKDVDNFKIDPSKYWADQGTGAKVGWFIAMALSGIGDALQHKSGVNPVVQMLQDAAARDVRLQMDQRDQLKDKANRAEHAVDRQDAFSQSQDAQYNLRLAQSDRMLARQVALVSAKIEDPAAQARAKQMIADLNQSAIDRGTMAAERATQHDMQRKELALKGAELAQNDRHFAAQQAQALQFHNDEMEVEKAKLLGQGKLADAKALEEHQKELQNGGFMVPTGVADDGSVKFDYMKQQDGKEYIAPEKAQENLRNVQQGTMQALDAIDKLRQLRHENGGDLTKWSPDARIKLAEYERALLGAHKASGLTGFRGNVMEVMDKQLSGGADPTAVFQSVMPSLDNAREDLERDYNSAFRSANYTGKEIKFPDPLKAAKPAESAEKQRNRVLEASVPEEDKSLITGPGIAALATNPAAKAEYLAARDLGVFPSQMRALQSMTPKELDALLDNPQIQPNVKSAAKALLDKNIRASLTPYDTGEPKAPAAPQPGPLVPQTLAPLVANYQPQRIQ